MTEKKQNFTVIQGDTKVMTIDVVDEAGSPKNLTGSTKRWKAFDKVGVEKISKADGDITLVNVAGTNDGLRFTLTPSDTVNLAPGPYPHEAEVVDSGSNVSTVTKGTLLVEKERLV